VLLRLGVLPAGDGDGELVVGGFGVGCFIVYGLDLPLIFGFGAAP
jgi:hypothetical protein